MSDTLRMASRRHDARRPRAGAADMPGIALRPGAGCYLWLKTGVEWVAALILLVLLLPMLAGLAVLQKLTSKGPVFYHQARLGRHGRVFEIYKLRTMTHRCEVATGPVWSIAGDPRVTRIGRWLRDTHLDEVPQLWNVLRGDMSLIGPRPERPEIAEKIERALPAFRDRLLVRPGITGLAQMRLPADSDLHMVMRKLEHDHHYIKHIGPILDGVIVLSTITHFVGMAATAVSRQLVQPFAPASTAKTPIAAIEPDLKVAGHRIGSSHAGPAREDLPWAA